MQDIGWPLPIAVFLIAATWVLRGPLGRFIDWARKISASGIESAPPPQDVSGELKKSEASELLKLLDSELIAKRGAAIREDLNSRGISEPQSREEALIRSLAASQIARTFDWAYYLIWGSQLALLQHLNPLGETGVEEARARSLYQAAAGAYPDVYQKYSFEEWLAFPASVGLTARSPGHVKITLYGREFLRYLLEVGRRMDKNL
jgi:hypothetical protein